MNDKRVFRVTHQIAFSTRRAKSRAQRRSARRQHCKARVESGTPVVGGHSTGRIAQRTTAPFQALEASATGYTGVAPRVAGAGIEVSHVTATWPASQRTTTVVGGW